MSGLGEGGAHTAHSSSVIPASRRHGGTAPLVNDRSHSSQTCLAMEFAWMAPWQPIDSFPQMLLREITVMDACSHPHLVRLYEVVEIPTRIHLVLQLAPGGELFTKLTEQGKPCLPTTTLPARQVPRSAG